MIPALHSGCTTCRGACCRTYLVHVNGRDALRLARARGGSLAEFVVVVPEADPPGSGFTLDDGASAYGLALRRAPDGACTFLARVDDGAERCSMYPQRPLACAMFPLRLVRGAIEIKPDVICDPSGRTIDVLELPLARELFDRATADWSEYAIVVATWNEFRAATGAACEARAYFAYLADAYAAIDAALGRDSSEHAPATIARALAPVVLRALGE